MAFHHEWTWYNIYYPNPDAALQRLGIDHVEWQRARRRKDTTWFKDKDLETSSNFLNNRKSIMPTSISYNTLINQQHQQRIPEARFSYERFYRMLLERKKLVRQGLLPPELPDPFPPCFNRHRY